MIVDLGIYNSIDFEIYLIFKNEPHDNFPCYTVKDELEAPSGLLVVRSLTRCFKFSYCEQTSFHLLCLL